MRIDPINCKTSGFALGKTPFTVITGFDGKNNPVHLIMFKQVREYLDLVGMGVHQLLGHTFDITIHSNLRANSKFKPFFINGGGTAILVSANGIVRLIDRVVSKGRKTNLEHASNLRRTLVQRYRDEIVQVRRPRSTFPKVDQQMTLDVKDKEPNKRRELHYIAKQQMALNKRVAALMGDSVVGRK